MLLGHQGGPSEGEQLVINPFEEIINSFGCWNDVEGRRNCPPVFKVRNPQLTTGKLPLSVRSFLNVKTEPDQLRKYNTENRKTDSLDIM